MADFHRGFHAGLSFRTARLRFGKSWRLFYRPDLEFSNYGRDPHIPRGLGVLFGIALGALGWILLFIAVAVMS